MLVWWLCALSFTLPWSGDAVRISQFDSEGSGDIHVVDPEDASDMNLTELLSQWVRYFGDTSNFPQDREALNEIRELDVKGGEQGKEKASEAKSTSRKFAYLGTKCMQERVTWATKLIKDEGCSRLLEVGGFRTPLPSIVSKDELALKLYVDVDPSATKTQKDKFEDHEFPAATLQILLDEFRDVEKNHFGVDFDCFLQLGTSNQNFKHEKDRKAVGDALPRAKVAIFEVPFSNTDASDEIDEIMTTAGFTMNSEKVVNCSEDKESLDKRDTEQRCGDDEDDTICLVRKATVWMPNHQDAKSRRKSKDFKQIKQRNQDRRAKAKKEEKEETTKTTTLVYTSSTSTSTTATEE